MIPGFHPVDPPEKYARNKVKEKGGSHDDYVAEFHHYHGLLAKILEEKGLMKDVPTPTLEDADKIRHPKTIIEAGLVESLPWEAANYGLADIMGFYHQITNSTPEEMAVIADLMQMSQVELLELGDKVSSILGEEYVFISSELAKYTRII